MLPPIFAADAFSVSRARCAWHAVVVTLRWPRSALIMDSPSPSARAREAYE